ncbi:hypothetical protein G7068_12025 [Leucobacter viscericola]|uniref:DUF3168 domain-containing protein n=1 Tax=Leucobacter viscericola TaxID=2714935 RepID=A0A6G7XHI2_9MICO|nr:hypothetical protein [Leucobacter viscericola]QIK63837.1 hypothetical protein G7068_12025 [Leucobacter viscericola]
MTCYAPKHYTAKLMAGIAERIHEAGLAVYDPTGEPYPEGVRGIYLDHSPTGAGATRQATCVITPYMPQAGILNIERTRVQIRARHPGLGALQVRDWLDDIRACFPDLTPITLGGLDFDRVRQIGSTTWGEPSATESLETTQNFEFRGNRYADD